MKKFDFSNEVKEYYPTAKVKTAFLNEIYNFTGRHGNSTEDTKQKGVYALFLNDELMKIGKATDTYGIFHRMSQYYRGDKNGGLEEIKVENREKVKVLYFNIDEKEIWYAERRLQVIAHDNEEKMPWEKTSRN